MTPLLYFYYGSHPDHKGRFLREILRQDDDWLEIMHDYIQWLFPLQRPSMANRQAPLLSRKDIEAFSGDEILQNHLRASFVRMLKFYGLEHSKNGIVKAKNWEQRKGNWFSEPTHNSLRISRMLECMKLLSLTYEAELFWSALEDLCDQEVQCGISTKSRKIWREIMI